MIQSANDHGGAIGNYISISVKRNIYTQNV